MEMKNEKEKKTETMRTIDSQSTESSCAVQFNPLDA